MKAKTKKLKRGISLAEVIVSIFVIALISATASSLIILSLKNDQTNLRNTQISLATKTAVDCFRFADNFDDFYSALLLTDNDYINSNDTITLIKEKFSLIIICDYSQKVVTINALDNKGQSLSTLSYNKG